jgi:hypothetical protein
MRRLKSSALKRQTAREYAPVFTILKEMQASFEKISWVPVSAPNT